MRRLKRKHIGMGFLLLIVLAAAGAGGILWQQQNQAKAQAQAAEQSFLPVGKALQQHRVSLLVVPSDQVQTVGQVIHDSPVQGYDDCRTPSNAPAWQQHSFAYVLDAAKGCSLDQVVAMFGKPNGSSVLAGSVEHPVRSLLFYDNGLNSHANVGGTPATVVPVTLDKLFPTREGCTGTTMAVAAHQDDDLLFMNPDIAGDIRSGRCVRTIYLTAGDGGHGQYYWLSREQGTEQAYSYMSPDKDDGVWVQRIVKLGPGRFCIVATPKTNTKLSIIFFRLPDGNIDGKGFAATKDESLAHLQAGSLKAIHSVDGQSSFSSADLQAGLVSLFKYYEPDLVRTLSTQHEQTGNRYLEHSDHITTGSYTSKLFKDYSSKYNSTLVSYNGYLIHGKPANISGPDLNDKIDIFLQYAQHDKAVCQTRSQCLAAPTYGSYLTRQYPVAN